VDKQGYIEIRVQGQKGKLDLSPDTYDIRDIRRVLKHVENLLFPEQKKGRPTISYKIEEGSVRHLFKTGIQAIIGFNAIIGQVQTENNIDFLESNTSKAIESIQQSAVKSNYKYTISTSLDDTNDLQINTETSFYRSEDYWVDAEFYFYGKLTNAGGKNKANIHLDTEEMGTIYIDTPISFLEELEENLLYKPYGIRASGKQHIETGEVDKSSLEFLELIDHNPKYDPDYLASLREKASSWIKEVNKTNLLDQLRGRNGKGSTS